MMALSIKWVLFTLFISSIQSRSLLQNNLETSGELVGTESPSDCACDWRFFRHYETRGCQVSQVDECGCPKRFSCPNDTTVEAVSKTCLYKDKPYPVGSKIPSSNVCQMCRCVDGPRIHCLSRECPQLDVPLRHDCHLIYEENRCCPTGFQCVSESEEGNRTSGLCEYEGRLYPLGSKIYSADDPCLECDCTPEWGGVANASCRQHDCLFEKNKHLLDAGCIPVYHEGRCCPINFYCPHNDLASSIVPSNASEENSVELDSHCLFAGQLYSLGSTLPVNDSCVSCECLVPPDFTCVHRACLRPSAENCRARREPGVCCPLYDCELADGLDVEDEDGIETGCPTPLCADSSCRIEVPVGAECPTCICDESESLLEKNELMSIQDFSEDMEAQSVDNNVENEIEYEARNTESPEDVDNDREILEEMTLSPPGNESDNATELVQNSDIEDESNSRLESEANEIFPEADRMQADEKHAEEMDADLENDSRNMQKRSQDTISLQQQESLFDQEQDGIEREGGVAGGPGDDYDGEIKSFQGAKNEHSKKTEDPATAVDVEVPDGCPTPMCANPTCRITIPPGHHCPTCICKGDGNRQP